MINHTLPRTGKRPFNITAALVLSIWANNQTVHLFRTATGYAIAISTRKTSRSRYRHQAYKTECRSALCQIIAHETQPHVSRKILEEFLNIP